jgi:hypothetical protein
MSGISGNRWLLTERTCALRATLSTGLTETCHKCHAESNQAFSSLDRGPLSFDAQPATIVVMCRAARLAAERSRSVSPSRGERSSTSAVHRTPAPARALPARRRGGRSSACGSRSGRACSDTEVAADDHPDGLRTLQSPARTADRGVRHHPLGSRVAGVRSSMSRRRSVLPRARTRRDRTASVDATVSRQPRLPQRRTAPSAGR